MDPDWDEASSIPPQPTVASISKTLRCVMSPSPKCAPRTRPVLSKLQLRLRELLHAVDADPRTETRHPAGMESIANPPRTGQPPPAAAPASTGGRPQP